MDSINIYDLNKLMLFKANHDEPITVALIMDMDKPILFERITFYCAEGILVSISNGKDYDHLSAEAVIYYDGEIISVQKVLCISMQTLEFFGLFIRFSEKNISPRFSRKLFHRADFGYELNNPAETKQALLALCSEDKDIKISLASPEDLQTIYRFRYRNYFELGKVDEEIFPGAMVVDKFDACSTILKATITDNIIGTIRITFEEDVDEFELEEDFGTKLRDGILRYAEVSRLCVDKYFRGSFGNIANLYSKLFAEVFRYCLRGGAEKLILSALKAHRHFYARLGFETISDAFTMGKFKYEYYLMSVPVHYSSVNDLIIREKFIEVYKEEQTLR